MFIASLHHHRPGRRAPMVAAGALLLCLGLASCAQVSTTSEQDPSPGAPETGTGTTSNGNGLPGPADPDDPVEGPPALEWLPPGPADPSDPPPNFWYELLSARECDTLIAAEDGALWISAGWICDGLNTGSTESWDAGIAAFAQIEGTPQHCLEKAAFGLLQRLVAYYQEWGQPEEFVPAEPGGTACALELTGLQPWSDGADETAACGGDRFRLLFRVMDVTSVDVGGVTVGVENQGTHQYVFTAPEAGPGAKTVIARTDSGDHPGGTTLTYAADCGGESP